MHFHNPDGLTLYLQVSLAAFAFCFKANLSSILLADRGDGESVAAATVLHLILCPSSDWKTLVKPSHTGICWCDCTLEYGVLTLHGSYIVEFGGQSNLSWRLKEKEGVR